MQILYTLFWTWVLSSLCNSGYKTVAWVLVVIPFVVLVLFFSLIISYISIDSPSTKSSPNTSPSQALFKFMDKFSYKKLTEN